MLQIDIDLDTERYEELVHPAEDYVDLLDSIFKGIIDDLNDGDDIDGLETTIKIGDLPLGKVSANIRTGHAEAARKRQAIARKEAINKIRSLLTSTHIMVTHNASDADVQYGFSSIFAELVKLDDLADPDGLDDSGMVEAEQTITYLRNAR